MRPVTPVRRFAHLDPRHFARIFGRVVQQTKKALAPIIPGKKRDAKAKARNTEAEAIRVEVRKAIRLERERWSTVMSSSCAASNLQAATLLLSECNKSAEHIIGNLRKMAAADASHFRRERNPHIDAGGEPTPTRSSQIAASWQRAFNVVHGGKQ